MADTYKRRIDKKMAILLIGGAIIVDIAQAALNVFIIGIFVNKIISVCVGFAWWMFLASRKVSIIANPKKAVTNFAGYLSELVPMPILDTIPAWSATVIITIALTWREDTQLIAQTQGNNQAQVAQVARLALQKKVEAEAEQEAIIQENNNIIDLRNTFKRGKEDGMDKAA